jgi:hypothetical protein
VASSSRPKEHPILNPEGLFWAELARIEFSLPALGTSLQYLRVLGPVWTSGPCRSASKTFKCNEQSAGTRCLRPAFLSWLFIHALPYDPPFFEHRSLLSLFLIHNRLESCVSHPLQLGLCSLASCLPCLLPSQTVPVVLALHQLL